MIRLTIIGNHRLETLPPGNYFAVVRGYNLP